MSGTNPTSLLPNDKAAKDAKAKEAARLRAAKAREAKKAKDAAASAVPSPAAETVTPMEIIGITTPLSGEPSEKPPEDTSIPLVAMVEVVTVSDPRAKTGERPILELGQVWMSEAGEFFDNPTREQRDAHGMIRIPVQLGSILDKDVEYENGTLPPCRLEIPAAMWNALCQRRAVRNLFSNGEIRAVQIAAARWKPGRQA